MDAGDRPPTAPAGPCDPHAGPTSLPDRVSQGAGESSQPRWPGPSVHTSAGFSLSAAKLLLRGGGGVKRRGSQRPPGDGVCEARCSQPTPTGHGGDEQHPPLAACCRETRGHHSPGGGRRETGLIGFPAINTKGLCLYNLCSSGGRGSSICEFPQTWQRVPEVSQRAALKLYFTVTNRTPSHWSNPDRPGPRCRSDALTGS